MAAKKDSVVAALAKAAKGLEFPSESDAPFEAFAWPDGDKLKLVERMTLQTPDVIKYEVTIEDPDVFTAPWKISMPIYRRMEANAQLLDYRCIEFAEEFMYGNLRRQPLVRRWEGETLIVDIRRKVPAGEKLHEWYRR